MGYTSAMERGERPLKVDIRIDPSLKKPEIEIRAPAATPEVLALAQRLRQEGSAPTFAVAREGETLMLPLTGILRFFTDGKGVSCQTAGGIYSVRQRMYELEERLEGTRFARVSHSEIVNLDKISALDLSLTGTIRMTLEEGTAVYASRRYVKKIKAVLGLGRD